MSYDLSHMTITDRSHEIDARIHGTLPAGYQKQGVLFHATACRNPGDSSENYLLTYHEPLSSSDQLIRRDGSIVQLIPAGGYAYHSGPAVWEGFQDGEHGLNMAYYGVEIENTNDGREPYTHEQIVSAAATYAYKSALHRWPTDRRMAKHYEVAIYSSANTSIKSLWGKFGRKSDPYKFPWRQFYEVLAAIRADWPIERFGIPLWLPPAL